MKRIILLSILCAAFISCEKATPQSSTGKDNYVTIVFAPPVKSGYDATDESINGWLIIDGITYTAQYSYFEACEPAEIKEYAFMDMDSWINCISIRSSEVSEVLEERVEDGIIYRKCKMRCPIVYNDFSFDMFYIEERAFTSGDKGHMFPIPSIESDLAYNRETRQPDVTIGKRTYKCYLVELGIELFCAEKSIVCEASFFALDEKE